ncbi:hypothetical protein AX774_g398 [Zancudomyces culisetae]|uniref:Secreted protein n=1 Tax=Zancudomyces culisetae TaxID=1213189 RepID=A0A1R1PYP6_ZANCU|nr:hypothetical protein AX774_g398 [Zancudomyces culisetae]|eukprot:OMH86049.1 hypothetical protein AX774_g398 [Zancudomyces culisetae]
MIISFVWIYCGAWLAIFGNVLPNSSMKSPISCTMFDRKSSNSENFAACPISHSPSPSLSFSLSSLFFTSCTLLPD